MLARRRNDRGELLHKTELAEDALRKEATTEIGLELVLHESRQMGGSRLRALCLLEKSSQVFADHAMEGRTLGMPSFVRYRARRGAEARGTKDHGAKGRRVSFRACFFAITAWELRCVRNSEVTSEFRTQHAPPALIPREREQLVAARSAPDIGAVDLRRAWR